jgi:hypothetical protein
VNRKSSDSEKILKQTVRESCDDVRTRLEGRRDGGYVTKDGLVELINRRVIKIIKGRDAQQAMLIAMLPRAVPGYWLLIKKGLTSLVSSEFQRKSLGLALWESYYDDPSQTFRWIPRAVITADLADQMAKERRESAEPILDMADVWTLVAKRLRGTRLLFADVEQELMPQIKAILAK